MVYRGRVLTLELDQAILFNGTYYFKIHIEINHINYGLNPETKALNDKKRSSFSVISQLLHFILELDDLDLLSIITLYRVRQR